MISFALSFMNEGDAASYKEQMLEEAMEKAGPLNLRTWTSFVDDLTAAFKPYDAPGDVLEEMKML